MSNSSRLRKSLTTWWLKFYNAMYRMQLAHYGGKYSVERMLALEEYTRSTSLLRVVIVIVSPPLFTAAVLLWQESVPLQDPKHGWQANWGFWFRVGMLGIVNGHETSSQVSPWFNVPRLSSKQVAVFSIFTAIGLIGGGMAVAELWVFPIPFFLLSMSLVFIAVLVGSMRVVAGKTVFNLIASRKKELGSMIKVAMLESIMCAGYPAYQILFTKVNGTSYELPVTLLLPVIKLVMKRIFRSAATHEEDMIPKQVIFTVDLFDSFYLATFMQRLAPTTLVVVMLVDVAESAMELHDLHQRTGIVLARLNEVAEIKTENNGNLFGTIRDLLNGIESLKTQLHVGCRVHSCITHQLSTDCRILLQKLDGYPLVRSSDSASQHSEGKTNVTSKLSSVVPLPDRLLSGRWAKLNSLRTAGKPSLNTVETVRNSSKPVRVVEQMGLEKIERNPSRAAAAAILNESLETLFTSECLVLTEYVEIITPLIYGLFILVTIRLPSAIYHSEMEGVTLNNVGGMVARMFVYALLEFISFVVLAIITKRHCGIDVLYQLAFVLETEIAFVPSKLVLWILYTLSYRVTHFGPDVSFLFEWIKHPTGA